MSYRTCCVHNCIVVDGQGIPLHAFPNPSMDMERFQLWVRNVGTPLKDLEDIYIFRNRRVCHRHFETLYHYPKNRLSKLAVPTLHLNDEWTRSHGQNALRVDNELITCIQNMPTTSQSGVCVSLHEQTSATAVNKPAAILPCLPSQSGVCVRPHEQHSATAVNEPAAILPCLPSQSGVRERPREQHGTVVNAPTATLPCLPCPSGTKRRRFVKGTESVMKSMKKLKLKIAHLEKTKNDFKKRLALTRKCLRSPELENLKNWSSLNKDAQTFIKMQLNLARRKSKGRRFTLKEKIIALSLYKPSPKAYRVLSEMCILPKRKTLQGVLQKVKLFPGINKHMFKNLKKKVLRMPRTHKYCTLIFDEMSIAPGLTYDKKNDMIVGFTDDGEKRTKEYADHVLVFMVRGIIKKFKQPIAFSFCASTSKTLDLKNQIKDVLRELQNCGLNVVATVCDQGATNMAAINSLLKDTKEKYLRENKEWRGGYFSLNNQKIFPIFDPPHLMKGIRNNLLNKNLIYKSGNKKCVAKWEHIINLYKRSPGYKGVKMAPRLTAEHVLPNLIPKMRVKHCTQVFSSTVAVTMGIMADYGKLPEASKETADILLFFDKLFDSVNGSYSEMKQGKIYRTAVTPKSPHHRLWRESIAALKDMKFDHNGKETVVPSLSSWIKTLETFEILTKYLHDLGMTSLLMRNFNQDPIENFFGAIRAHGQSNIMPNAAAFQAAFKTLLINNITSPHSVGANCEKDEGKCLQNLTYFFKESKDNNKSSLCPTIQEEHLNMCFSNTILFNKTNNDMERCAAIGYCSGWLVKIAKKQIVRNCQTCKGDLESDTVCDFHKYIKVKDYSEKGWLCYPTRAIFDMFYQIENICMEVLRTSCEEKNLSSYIKLLISFHCNTNFLSCDRHKNQLLDFFIDKCVTFCIHNWCKEINQIICGKSLLFDNENEMKRKAHDHYAKYKLRKRKTQTDMLVNM